MVSPHVLVSRLLLTSAVALSVLLTGCGTPNKTDKTKPAVPLGAPLSVTDPCATRLHDLEGALLLYYYTYRRLPAKLEDLAVVEPEGQAVPLTCPVSGLPYVYDPHGPPHPTTLDRLIVYDPAPSHAGFRWTIAAVEPKEGTALVVKVIAVRENALLWPTAAEVAARDAANAAESQPTTEPTLTP